VFGFVYDIVEDGQSCVAHGDLVGIGETEGESEVANGEVFFDLVYLAGDVSGGSSDERQKFTVDAFGQYCYLFFIHGSIIWYPILRAIAKRKGGSEKRVVEQDGAGN